MTKHEGVTQDYGIPRGCPVGTQWPLLLPLTWPGGPTCPGRPEGPGSPGLPEAPRSPLGPSRPCRECRQHQDRKTPEKATHHSQGQGQGSEAAPESSTHFSSRGSRIPLLSLWKTKCFRHGRDLRPEQTQVRGFTFLPSSPGSPGSPCGQRTHVSPNIHLCLAARHCLGGPQVSVPAAPSPRVSRSVACDHLSVLAHASGCAHLHTQLHVASCLWLPKRNFTSTHLWGWGVSACPGSVCPGG